MNTSRSSASKHGIRTYLCAASVFLVVLVSKKQEPSPILAFAVAH